MNDRDVLDTVRHGLAPARMDRPLAAVVARGRTRRRHRRLVGAAGVAGLALVVGVGLAVTLPDRSPAGAPIAAQSTGQPMKLAGFTLETAPDGTVTVVLGTDVDPQRLQDELARAGVTAIVRTSELCWWSTRTTLPPHALEVEQRPAGRTLVVRTAQVPDGITLGIGLFSIPGTVLMVSVSRTGAGELACQRLVASVMPS